MKKRVRVLIERGTDGTYGAYMPDVESDDLPFSCSGDGATAREAIEDFKATAKGMEDFLRCEKIECPELEFVFDFDTASFLQYYQHIFTLSGLSKITGVSPGQLSHYLNGYRHPSPSTVTKIKNGLLSFTKELEQVAAQY